MEEGVMEGECDGGRREGWREEGMSEREGQGKVG